MIKSFTPTELNESSQVLFTSKSLEIIEQDQDLSLKITGLGADKIISHPRVVMAIILVIFFQKYLF